MEIISNAELAVYFGELKAAVEALGNAKSAAYPQQEYFTRDEAADYLRMSTRTLDGLVSAGEIRKAKVGNGKTGLVLFRRRDLDEYVESRLVDAR